jgi:hypothetical protein
MADEEEDQVVPTPKPTVPAPAPAPPAPSPPGSPPAQMTADVPGASAETSTKASAEEEPQAEAETPPVAQTEGDTSMDVNLGDADSAREIPAGSSVVQLICRSYSMVLTYDDIANFLRSTGVLPGFIVVDPEHRNEAFAVVSQADRVV